MKRRLIVLLLLLILLLPVASLAVPENVVQPAPDVAVEIAEMTDELFGVWQQGLSDIRASAVQAARAWKPGIAEMSLEQMALRNSPMDGEAGNDKLSVYFIYLTEERKNARLTARYLRGTGELIWISDTLDGGGEQHPGEGLSDLQLEEIALKQLKKYAGTQDAALCEGDNGEMAHRWIARFASQAGIYEVCLDRQTGEAIRVSLYIKEEIE